MARDIINVQLPIIENTADYDVATLTVEKQTVNVENGVELANAFACMRNTLVLTVENTGSDATVTVKAGGHYPNAMRGDMVKAVGQGTTELRIQDPSRFETADGSLLIDFSDGFAGTICATAKPTGVGQGVA